MIATENFDMDQAMKVLDGSVDMLSKMVEMFKQLVPGIIQEFDECACSGDLKKLSITAHTLKTRSQYVGGCKVNKTALIIEKLAKSGEHEEALSFLPQIKEEINLLVNDLNVISESCH